MSKGNELIKISFTGDIMCEGPLLRATTGKDSIKVFNKIYRNTSELFEKSDYIVGNLETISAGAGVGYTNHIYNFNTPESFIDSIKMSGIDLVTTATNHSLDRGIEGLKRNLDTLEKFKLKNIGTYKSLDERNKVYNENIKGVNIAFLNYTYGTNAHVNGVKLNKDELFHVNLLKSQEEELKRYNLKTQSKKIKRVLRRLMFKIITLEQWIKLKRILGLKYNEPSQDNSLSGIEPSFLEQVKLDIRKAKTTSDFVVMCMHSGGQFNIEPGKFSKYMMNFMLENGVDAVIGNHPHIVQKHEISSTGAFGAYSLGNFSISPSSVYLLEEDLPEYSIMLHLYLCKKSKNLKKITFSILKIIEHEDLSLEVFPINKLANSNISEADKEELILNATTIYNRFLNTDKKEIEILEEYLVE